MKSSRPYEVTDDNRSVKVVINTNRLSWEAIQATQTAAFNLGIDFRFFYVENERTLTLWLERDDRDST